MKWFVGLLVCAILSDCALITEKNDQAEKYGRMITATDLREYLNTIASDTLEGRRTGTRGQKMAAAFIRDTYKQIGLTPPVDGSYFQSFELYSSVVEKAFVRTGETKYENYGAIVYTGSRDSQGEVATAIVFVGKGTDEDYHGIDVKDKAVAIITPLPTGSVTLAVQAVVKTATDKGARMVFIMPNTSQEEFAALSTRVRNAVSNGHLSLKKPESEGAYKGVFLIDKTVAAKLFDTDFEKLLSAGNDPKKRSVRKVKPGRLSYRIDVQISTVKTENVLGFLEGGDKKDEVVIVTAHYDHIGMVTTGSDRINNGADDDGSGTVAVLEIAKSFANAKKEGHGPRRSILFMTVVAEEQGLLGSEYYAAHPVEPLASTVVDLNIDMIGRVDPEHRDTTHYVYVIGSDKMSQELHQLSEQTNATYTQLKFDYTYNDEGHPSNLYKRSDHWNFAKNGIPVIFYFDGIHEDYHRPSDEISRIDFDLLTERTRCIFYTAWEVANREGRIAVDKK